MRCVSGEVFGNVQKIMFRQTFIRALIKYKLKGGASNDQQDCDKVSFSIEGEKENIDLILKRLVKLTTLNSWGAKVEKLIIHEEYTPFHLHQVTTQNVDSFNWSEGVEFYL